MRRVGEKRERVHLVQRLRAVQNLRGDDDGRRRVLKFDRVIERGEGRVVGEAEWGLSRLEQGRRFGVDMLWPAGILGQEGRESVASTTPTVTSATENCASLESRNKSVERCSQSVPLSNVSEGRKVRTAWIQAGLSMFDQDWIE